MQTIPGPYVKVILVCGNEREPGRPACGSRGALDLLERLKAYVKAHDLKARVRVTRSGCLDLCERGPNLVVFPDNRWYTAVSAADLDEFIRRELAPLAEAPPGPRET